ncbi:hypothetical protein CVT24_002882 [Panaeolus cyanescens]|uniref:Uncharacterized protein n=1 Tax=Panaeolus cyanescens TaxID=181874 RepID=A0A409YXT4_9AGAR|nr:hypothetical protein CVT24_002882 [Panaeolus cyanescens]
MSIAPTMQNIAARAGPGPGFEFLVYKPKVLPAIVYSARQTIYNKPGDEALYGIVKRELEAMNWIQRIAWKNTSKAQQTYEYSFATSLKIIQGDEISMGFNMGASYEGMSMGFEFGTKTFKNTETTQSTTITVKVNVPPQSQVVFYQKRYDFRDNTTFVVDAWGQEWNVGPFGGYSPLTTKTSTTQIMAEEYFTSTKPLANGPGKMAVKTVTAAPVAATTRKRENVTERAKSFIASLKI